MIKPKLNSPTRGTFLRFSILTIVLSVSLITDHQSPIRLYAQEGKIDSTGSQNKKAAVKNKLTSENIAYSDIQNEPTIPTPVDTSATNTTEVTPSEIPNNSQDKDHTISQLPLSDKGGSNAFYPKLTATPTIVQSNVQDTCGISGGTTEEFNSSCADTCAFHINPRSQCLHVMTSSCDCGINACWNGTECVDNPSLPEREIICENNICEITKADIHIDDECKDYKAISIDRHPNSAAIPICLD